MELSAEQRAILDGSGGPEMQRALVSLVRYGDAFGAPRLVRIKSAHLAGSFAIAAYSGYYELLDRLVAAGIRVKVPTTVNPHPGYDFSLTNRWVVFRKQPHHEAQLARLGVTPNYSCVCYLGANVPEFGDILGWAESSAVVYANSAIGARTNRNSIMIDVCMAITGLTPEFGFLCDGGRRGEVLVKLDVDRMDANAVGYLVGQTVVDRVPVLTHFPFDRVQLKNMGAAMAASGGVGLFHVEGVTPEAPTLDAVFDDDPAQVLTITQKDLDNLRCASPEQKAPAIVAFGCPQMNLEEVQEIGARFVGKKVRGRTLFHVIPSDFEKLRQLPLYDQLIEAGVEVLPHCPLAAMSLRIAPGGSRVLTTSGKLHYYLQDCDYGNPSDALRAAGVEP